jgi:hypothetical protein
LHFPPFQSLVDCLTWIHKASSRQESEARIRLQFQEGKKKKEEEEKEKKGGGKAGGRREIGEREEDKKEGD